MNIPTSDTILQRLRELESLGVIRDVTRTDVGSQPRFVITLNNGSWYRWNRKEAWAFLWGATAYQTPK